MLPLKDIDLFRQQGLVDGAWIPADSGAASEVANPSTGEVLGRVPRMGAAETRRAVAAAGGALPGWRRRTAAERSAVLRRWFELVMAHQEDLAALMTLEQGKPLAESRSEIAYAASAFFSGCCRFARLPWSSFLRVPRARPRFH